MQSLSTPRSPPSIVPIALQADLVKDTEWDDAQMEIALIAIPTIALIPYSKETKSTTLNNNFIKEMRAISIELGFWVQRMIDAADQH